jgi:hypothetical protein
MNRFQAMAKIMAMLDTEEENLQPGTNREYKIARKMVSRKIDRLGPEAALLQVVEESTN